MKHAYIYDGIRTAFGRHGGVLAHTRPDDLLSLCLKGLLARNDVQGDAIEDVIIGWIQWLLNPSSLFTNNIQPLKLSVDEGLR